MKEIIEELNKDINKCEECLKANNLLEMVIIIEEMIDKYKNKINKVVNLEKGNVWAYNKKDLEEIVICLENHKIYTFKKYKELTLKEAFEKAKEKIGANINLEKYKKEKVFKTIDNIKNIAYDNLSMEEAWYKVKQYIQNIGDEDFITGYELINLISSVFKIINSDEI